MFIFSVGTEPSSSGCACAQERTLGVGHSPGWASVLHPWSFPSPDTINSVSAQCFSNVVSWGRNTVFLPGAACLGAGLAFRLPLYFEEYIFPQHQPSVCYFTVPGYVPPKAHRHCKGSKINSCCTLTQETSHPAKWFKTCTHPFQHPPQPKPPSHHSIPSRAQHCCHSCSQAKMTPKRPPVIFPAFMRRYNNQLWTVLPATCNSLWNSAWKVPQQQHPQPSTVGVSDGQHVMDHHF